MKRLLALLPAALLPAAGLLLTGAAPPASAACATASVWVDRYHSTPTYVVGPDYCVAPTPFPSGGGVGDDVSDDEPEMQPGQPNGVGFWITAPSPVAAPSR